MDQTCTTDQYGNTGCIGTAVSTHGSTLPMTGFDVLPMAFLIVAVLAMGLYGRFATRNR